MPAGIDLYWTVGPSTVGGLDQVIFECYVNTTGLDPQLDLLDIKFMISPGTELETFTARPYNELPVQLLGHNVFGVKYTEETSDKKLAYYRKVNYNYYN